MQTLHECEDYFMVNKPFDMYINSENPNETNTVATKIARADSHLHTSKEQIHFVHRLDYATSGVLCIAKNKKAAAEAGKLFERRLTKKYYLAVVRGHVDFDCCDINYAIAEDQTTVDTNHKMIAIRDKKSAISCKAKSARTRVLVLEHGSYDGEPATVVLLKPFTGRRHQLRVHCHSIGHTILGDYTYSGGTDHATYRMFLHALRLVLPLKNKTIDIQTLDPYKSNDNFTTKWATTKILHQYSNKEELDRLYEKVDNNNEITMEFDNIPNNGEGSSQQKDYIMEADIKVEMEALDEENQYDTMDFLELACSVQNDPDPIELDGTESSPNPATGNHLCLHCFQDVEEPSLIDHMIEQHGYRRVQYKCKTCNNGYQDLNTLKLHRLTCKLPGKKRKKTLLQIMAVVNTLVDEYTDFDTVPCPVCTLEIDKNFIREHVASEHHKPENLTCELCNRTFKNRLTLKEHIKLVHLSLHETEECEQCGQKFRSVKYLRNHRRNVHPTGNKIHKCQFCGKIFKSRLNVHQHQKHVHPPETASVNCEICDKTFKSKINLAQHMKVSHGVYPNTKRDEFISGEERIVVPKETVMSKVLVDKCEQTGE